VPRHDHAVLKSTSQRHGTTRHGRGIGICGTASSAYHAEIYKVVIRSVSISNLNGDCQCETKQRLLTFSRLNAIGFIYGISPYRAENTFHRGSKNQSVNDV
jgi:hypothetical protein